MQLHNLTLERARSHPFAQALEAVQDTRTPDLARDWCISTTLCVVVIRVFMLLSLMVGVDDAPQKKESVRLASSSD
jgi:hypothetical protein